MQLNKWSQCLPKIIPASRSRLLLKVRFMLEYLVKSAYQLLSNYDCSLRDLCTAFPDKFHEIRDFIDDTDLETRLKNDGMYALEQTRIIKKASNIRVSRNFDV